MMRYYMLVLALVGLTLAEANSFSDIAAKLSATHNQPRVRLYMDNYNLPCDGTNVLYAIAVPADGLVVDFGGARLTPLGHVLRYDSMHRSYDETVPYNPEKSCLALRFVSSTYATVSIMNVYSALPFWNITCENCALRFVNLVLNDWQSLVPTDFPGATPDNFVARLDVTSMFNYPASAALVEFAGASRASFTSIRVTAANVAVADTSGDFVNNICHCVAPGYCGNQRRGEQLLSLDGKLSAGSPCTLWDTTRPSPQQSSLPQQPSTNPVASVEPEDTDLEGFLTGIQTSIAGKLGGVPIQWTTRQIIGSMWLTIGVIGLLVMSVALRRMHRTFRPPVPGYMTSSRAGASACKA